MANQENSKLISTRIKNKIDDLTSWNASSGKLLDGEIAIVRVPTSYTDPNTKETVTVNELLMKVGDGKKTFAELPWLSAKASDVYDWAKGSTADGVKVKITSGSGETATVTEKTLAEWFSSLTATDEEYTSIIDSLQTAIAGGVHFRGVTTTDVSLDDNKTNNVVTFIKYAEGGEEEPYNYTAQLGDVVIYGTQEYIWTEIDNESGKWEPLGDVTRIGALETWRSGLYTTSEKNSEDHTENAVANTYKFASQVIQEDGKISVIYTRPKSEDILYDPNSTTAPNATVYDKVEDLDSRLDAVEVDYVRIGSDNKLYAGKAPDSGEVEVIIFDCGGASNLE